MNCDAFDFVKILCEVGINNEIDDILDRFLLYNRSTFISSMLLPLDSSLKGIMIYKLLDNHNKVDHSNDEYEMRIIMEILRKDDIEKSLKNLLILKNRRINNSRTKRIILKFLFERDEESLENISIKYRNKVSDLISHSLGRTDTFHILNGDKKSFRKHIGKHTKIDCINILKHLYNYPIDKGRKQYHRINDYQEIKKSCIIFNHDNFLNIMKKNTLPKELVLGLRNTYKLEIPINLIHDHYNSIMV